MPKLLADSSALLAYALDDDKNHRAAVSFVQEHPHARFVVTELIVAELATRTRAIAGAEQAGRVVRSLLDSRRHELIFVDLELLRAALDRLVRFADKRLSLTDCASFELMDRLSIDTAFTFDREFRDCGFSMAP